jgi:hypothetical protein
LTKKAWAPALAGVIGAWGLSGPAHAADPAPVIAAERAFAADGAKNGVQASFLRWSAPEAVVFAPDPVNAQAFYRARPDKGGAVLTWRPTYAGLAESGDLGFTTGPYAVNGKPGGHYFTVWARQPDGSWKWIYDGGVDNDASTAPPADASVAAMPGMKVAAERPDAAMTAVGAAEDALAATAAQDAAAAYRQVLAADARVQGSPAAPATSPAAVSLELASRAQQIRFQRLGGGASEAGDLAWTYGSAGWDGGRGHYVRIWQRRDGWRLVFDQLLPAPPPKT